MPTLASQRALALAGLIILLIGVGHLFMPTYGYDAGDVSALSNEVREHFYALGTYAIAVFLLALGSLSLLYSQRPPTTDVALFATIMSLVWIARLVLELRFPVTVSIFQVANPHPMLVVVIATIAILCTIATLGYWSASPGRPT